MVAQRFVAAVHGGWLPVFHSSLKIFPSLSSCIHEQSVIETRQSKATMPEDNSLFLKRKRRAASGGTRTRDVLRTRQTLCQLSHRGRSAGQAESLARAKASLP